MLAFALATFFWRRAPRAPCGSPAGEPSPPRSICSGIRRSCFLLQATPGLSQLSTRLTTNRANAILVLLLALLAVARARADPRGRTDHGDASGPGAPPGRDGARLPGVRADAGTSAPDQLARRELRAAGAAPRRLPRAADRPPDGAPPPRARRLSLRRRPPSTSCGSAPASIRARRAQDYFPVTPKVRELQQAARGGRFADAGASPDRHGVDVRARGRARPRPDGSGGLRGRPRRCRGLHRRRRITARASRGSTLRSWTS